MGYRTVLMLMLVSILLPTGTLLVPDDLDSTGNGSSIGSIPPASTTFTPRRILEPFAPIVDLPVMPASSGDALVSPKESVLGIEINGESRAYSIDMMTPINNEVLNDTIGGEPVCITWCALCQSAIVYSRVVEGRTLTMRVAGMLRLGNMVMEDVETGTFWGQLAGRALEGKLGGSRLRPYPSVLTTWAAWRDEHPETTVPRFDREPLTPPLVRQVQAHADRISEDLTDDFLVAVSCGDQARGWTFEHLEETPVLNETLCDAPLLISYDPEREIASAFRREIDGRILSFQRIGNGLVDDQTGSSWDPLTGRAIDGPFRGKRLPRMQATISYVQTWKNFYPDAPVFSAEG